MLPLRSAGTASARARRRIRVPGVCIAAVIVAAAGVGGCSKFDAALGKSWATVDFKPNTSEATVLKVRAGCSHIPNVQAEAFPKGQDPQTMQYDLTFQTTNASDANLAQLQQCLQRYPSVAGIDFGDSGDDGG